MDKDGIPDICDSDIDGDGIANALGLITHENKDCAYNSGNMDTSLLQNQYATICSLDNAPLTVNANQLDLNQDGIGDA